MSGQPASNTAEQKSFPFDGSLQSRFQRHGSMTYLRLSLSIPIFLLLFMMCFLPAGEGNTYTTPYNKHVEPGETAYYYVRSWNNDHPIGVDVKFEITQDISHYNSQNMEFHLYPGEQDTMHLYVYTDGVTANEVHTNVTYFERDATESEWRERGATFFTTFIDHPESESSEEREIESGNIFILIGAMGIIGLLLYFLYNRSAYSIPVVRGYSRLKKDKLMENEIRRDIWELLFEYEDGLQIVEIQRELNVKHRRLVEYHLQKLLEYGYARKIDNLYYPAGIGVGKPFMSKIRDAMEEGARTPAQVAKRIGSYREKVRYHMKKNGMW